MTDFKRQCRAARKRVAHMDEVDGFADRDPRMILTALEVGLRHRNGCEFDAYVMLEDLLESILCKKED